MREYEIRENCIGTIMPGVILMIQEKSPDLELHSLLFKLDYLAEIPPRTDFFLSNIKNNEDASPIPTYVQADKKDVQHLLQYFQLLKIQSKSKKKNFSDKIAKGLIFSTIFEFASIYKGLDQVVNNSQSSRQEAITNQFFNLLRTHCIEERNVSFYADKLCLTPKYLSTLIKTTTGKSVFSWINTASILAAKVLLKTKDLSISQIAEELNFPNPSFFGRFFKKHTGMTPNEFRKIN